ncbi:MAG: hypothetical protein WCF84_17810 [Anaerolineae bacterium]
MPRNQWLVILSLCVGVLLVFCLLGYVALTRLEKQGSAAILMPPAPASRTSSPTAAPLANTIPTTTPVPTATATLVVQPGDQPVGIEGPPTETPWWGAYSFDPGSFYPTPTARPLRISGPVSDAWAKAEQMISGRYVLTMTLQGDTSRMPGSSGATGDARFFSFFAETNGGNSHIVLKGFPVLFWGGDAAQGLELIKIDNQFYVHGPAPLLGAREAKWYVGANDIRNSSNRINPGDMLNAFGGQNSDWSGFIKAGTDTLDGYTCDLYLGDRAATLRVFRSMDPTQVPGQPGTQGLTEAATQIWLCNDGYLHQMKLHMAGVSPDSTKPPFSFDVLLHLYDMGQNIPITPPANASPLPTPLFRTPTPAQ